MTWVTIRHGCLVRKVIVSRRDVERTDADDGNGSTIVTGRIIVGRVFTGETLCKVRTEIVSRFSFN